MELDPRTCYRALVARDARFDGRFFTAVRSTGIYCRPICPARTPKRDNCTFLPSAAAAEEQGYRPCLRCRPEASPGTPSWLGTSATVSRGIRLISSGALDTGGVDDLAARLGVGERHLRRLFLRHVGATPIAVVQTQRVHFAKKLLDETRLPITEISRAAGFSSVRRFNDAIRERFRRSPRELRGASAAAEDGSGLALKLAYRPPLGWPALIGYLAGRATPGVESARGPVYRRTVRVGGQQGWIEVRPVAGAHHLVAKLHLSGSSALVEAADRVRRIFDLGVEPREVALCLGRAAQNGGPLGRSGSLRVPGAWDGFELAVRAVLGQQVTVRGATTLAGRLVAAHGEALPPAAERPAELRLLFPTAEALAHADLAGSGLPHARAGTIGRLARAVAEGELSLEPSAPYEETVARLIAIPGIGDWTAQYIAMRALGHPDAFPAGDLGLRRACANGAGRLPSAAELERIAEAWRPWRAYAAMRLWMSTGRREER